MEMTILNIGSVFVFFFPLNMKHNALGLEKNNEPQMEVLLVYLVRLKCSYHV